MAAPMVDELMSKYEAFVIRNPATVGQIESGLRGLSYILPASLDSSGVWSELLYSASNLLVLAHDLLLSKSIPDSHKQPDASNQLLQALAVLDSVEVFFEISSLQISTGKLRWIIIIIIQMTKLAIRLYMLLKHKRGLLSTPPVPAVNREQMIKKSESDGEATEQEVEQQVDRDTDNITTTFQLKRSGRVVRRLAGAPPVIQRSWRLPTENSSTDGDTGHEYHTQLKSFMMAAEALHISRPMTHLIAMYLFGQSSWRPWMLACAMDISSLCLYGEPSLYNKKEKLELKRRAMMLLLYLLRSPFYDRFSRVKVMFLLQIMCVPGLSLILRPLMEYLPIWQKIYFYIWST